MKEDFKTLLKNYQNKITITYSQIQDLLKYLTLHLQSLLNLVTVVNAQSVNHIKMNHQLLKPKILMKMKAMISIMKKLDSW